MSRPVQPLRVQPLWAPVDQNRVKLAAFVISFVLGSGLLLTRAFVALPASLIGAFGASYEGWWGSATFTASLPIVILVGYGLFAIAGAFIAAFQLSNAEDWVGSGDASYDGIFYAATSGTPRVERVVARRFARPHEVLGTDGMAAPPLEKS